MVQIAYADTITVGPTPGPGIDYTSIQAAIDAAFPGDIIEVRSGTYYENVNVNKQLTLTGVGDPVVNAGGVGSAITLSAGGCTLEGFVATNSTRPYPIFDVGIKVNSDGNTIEGNNVTGNDHGISLSSSSGNTISDNTANGNYFDGIRLEYSSGNTISDNAANGNNNGITIYSSSDNNIIIGNTARDNRDSGIKLGYYKGDNNTIEGNTVICNKLYGIDLRNANNNNIIGNTATGNTQCGIKLAFSSGNTIEGNTATGTTRQGIYLDSSSGNTIYLNRFDSAYSSDSTNLWNTPEPVTYAYNDMTFTNYTGNRWSDYSGYDANNDGIGDTPYTIVFGGEMDFYPLATQNGLMYVTLSKTANLSSGAPSTKVLFTIEVKNTGIANLDTLTVQDELPYGLEYISSNPEGNLVGNKVTWNLGPLASGLLESIELVAHINGSNYGPLKNRANFTATNTTAGTLEGNDAETVTALRAGIEVNKTANLNSGAPSTNLYFTIDVKNSGEADLVSVTLEDLLPIGLDYISDDSGLPLKQEGNIYTWDLGRLNSGGSISFNLNAHINGDDYGELVNRVNATGKPEHGDRVEGNDTETVTALRAGIEINKTANLSSGAPSTNLNFTIEVLNTGEADLVSVNVSDFLPYGFDYVSDDSGLPLKQEGNVYIWNIYTWNLGRLNSSESIGFNLTAHINGEDYGELVNWVDATGLPEHGDQVQDYDAETVTALRSGIDMEMTADPELAALFSDVTFTINVTNTGEISLDPVILLDELPEGMTYVSADPNPDGTGSIRWDNIGTGSLAPGETATINLTARIDGDAKGPLVNLASATGSPIHGDNVSCCCSADVRLPGLGVNKTANKKKYERGEEITYSIIIENLADVPVYDVVVRDVFNRGVEFVSADPMPDPDGIWRFDVIPASEPVTITLVVRVPKQDFEFDMGSGVSGEGFVNVANDYSTTLLPYDITNRVYVTSKSTSGEFSDSETVTVLADPGTELETREHGSGTYHGEEQLKMRIENKSISVEKDVSATYATTTLGLYNNRTAIYSSKWTEEARAKNRITGASMTESYRYATSIDRESRMFLDENESAMEIESEFEGMGHFGFLKMPTNSSTPQTPLLFEAREDYAGSFKVLEKVDEYGSSVTSEKSTSGVGLVAVDKRVGESQRSYESGSGSYDSEELIETNTNYIAKDISVVHGPMNHSSTDDVSIESSQRWKEGMYSKTSGTSYIGEEYTGVTQLDKETVALGLNEMDTEANFSGRARYRAILKDEVDFDEQYEGDYSLQRRILFTGVPKYDRPHLTVVKNRSFHKETIFDAKETTLAGESRDEVITVATYSITIENDGNKALGPIYVKDIFPPKAVYINASVRPSELTDSYANWTLTHLAIGDVSTIVLNLDVTKHVPSELVNRVEVCGGYDGDEQVCAFNFSALEVEWLSCCTDEMISVRKTGQGASSAKNRVLYRIEIENRANVTRAATVTDNLPEGMILLETRVPFASYENETVVWNLAEIGPFETVTIGYLAEALWSGRFVNSVEVDARSVDGPVVQPVRAECVVEIGEFGGERMPAGWQPPDWGFVSVCDENCELTG